jgi:hypothetical protein
MGGIPAVRQAVDKQNEQARLSGAREVAAEPLLAIAERLLPDLRAAEWRDKAEAALADVAELDLRDLRSVVVASDGNAKDDETRQLAEQLRTGLAERVDREQAAWLSELEQTLTEGRVVRALRLSSRPPKAGAPLPAELATKLAAAASAALTADTAADRWGTVLDALSFSPVRLSVVPASKPDAPSEELVATITRMADRVPKVAEAFGIDPGSAPKRRSRGGAGRSGAKPRPPKPPKPAQAPKAEAPSPAPETDASDPAPAEHAPADESAEAAADATSTEASVAGEASTETTETSGAAASEVPDAEASEVPDAAPAAANDAAPEPADGTASDADAPTADEAPEAPEAAPAADPGTAPVATAADET